jgi:hypothetical protein
VAGSAVLGVHAAQAVDPMAALETALFGAPTTDPRPTAVARFGQEIAAARTVYRQGRYPELASTLPRLLATANAARAHVSGERIERQVAELYTLSTELLVKLGDDQMAWTTADRRPRSAGRPRQR